jgi:hypothetical protein
MGSRLCKYVGEVSVESGVLGVAVWARIVCLGFFNFELDTQ